MFPRPLLRQRRRQSRPLQPQKAECEGMPSIGWQTSGECHSAQATTRRRRQEKSSSSVTGMEETITKCRRMKGGEICPQYWNRAKSRKYVKKIISTNPLQRPSKFYNIKNAERLRNLFLTTPPRFVAPQTSDLS